MEKIAETCADHLLRMLQVMCDAKKRSSSSRTVIVKAKDVQALLKILKLVPLKSSRASSSRKQQKGGAIVLPSEYFGSASGAYHDLAAAPAPAGDLARPGLASTFSLAGGGSGAPDVEEIVTAVARRKKSIELEPAAIKAVAAIVSDNLAWIRKKALEAQNPEREMKKIAKAHYLHAH